MSLKPAGIVLAAILFSVHAPGNMCAEPSEGLRLSATTIRRNFLRMEEGAAIGIEAANEGGAALMDASLRFYVDGRLTGEKRLPAVEPGGRHQARVPVKTSLRPGAYDLKVEAKAGGASTELVLPFRIIGRDLPRRMPVVMWGGGTFEELKEVGFTHRLLYADLSIDLGEIWARGEPVPEVTRESFPREVDEALAENIRYSVYSRHIGPSHMQERVGNDPEGLFNRVGRDGKQYEDRRYNVCGLFEEIQDYCYNVGASLAAVYGKFPAWDSAMIHTEQRDGTYPCFHEHDREAYREYSGEEIPEEAQMARGVNYRNLPGFPRDRIIPDDHPLLVYYKWFWRDGDGWNNLHTRQHQGLKSTGRDDIWTWFDPAVRVPGIWGSGGGADIISHWTYTYPNPEAIGLAADELFAMARGASNPDQGVMKQTQIIWYRDRAAPEIKETGYRARWEEDFPGAQFITIAPDHLSIALWSKISRPVRGITYHGLQSLFDYGSEGYAYTNPDTKKVLGDLVRRVIEPLGPALMQVPDAPADVAFLQSFSSQIFAGRRGGWGNDAYLLMRHAQLQPEIVYEETLLKDGLEGYSALAVMDCDVLPGSVAERVREFQMRGGIIIGDENLAPGIRPDIVIRSQSRPPAGDDNKRLLLGKAASLREELDAYISRISDSDNPDVLTRVRRYGGTDYLFAYNDSRKFGDYVGHHGLVMEEGVPASAVVKLNRGGGHVYDLVAGEEVPAVSEGGWMKISREFSAAEGTVWMVTSRPVSGVRVSAPGRAGRGESFDIEITVADDGGAPMDAVVPVRVEITDPRGEEMEFSGYYGAKDGRLVITCDPAENDEPGVWKVQAVELASGITGETELRVD